MHTPSTLQAPFARSLRGWLRATGCALLISCGGSDPAAPIRVATVGISPPNATVVAGSTQQYTADLRGSGGELITGRAITWSSSNASVATVDATGLATAVSPGAATITASSEARSAPASITVLPVPVASVTITPLAAPPAAGSTFQLTASTLDARGNALTGRAVTWAAGNTDVATITSTGLVTAVAPGSVTFIATSEGRSGTLVVIVLPAAVASVSVTPASPAVAAGSTQRLVATPRDARGLALTDRTVTWSTGNAAVASVNSTGLVTGVSIGSAVISAMSEGVSGSANVAVTPPPPAPTITSVTPAAATPGIAITITGTGFDTSPVNNTVTVRGASAQVVNASATQLIVFVPCVESGAARVRVTSGGIPGDSATITVTVPQRTLSVGQSLVLTSNQASLCNELATGSPSARYVVTVFNSATSPNTLVDFDLGGSTPVSFAAQPAVRLPPTFGRAYAEAPVPQALRAEAARDASRDAAHWAMLERNRADYERLMATARAQPRAASAALRAIPLPKPSDMRSLFFTYQSGCADSTRIVRGRAIYIGTRSIIWEDSANALQSSADVALADYYERLGRIFDTDQYDAIKSTFGDPLLRDEATDGDERVHMVFSSRLNGTGAAAYVTSCDQFPRSASSGGSNHGQFFYGIVPTTTGSNVNNTAFPDGWFNFMARTVVHEVKHIASLSARVANASPSFEQSWLEEGTARHAEEVWVRESLHKVAWKANTGFGTAATNGVHCDFLPGDAGCLSADPLRRPSYGMRRHFNEVLDKLVQPWNWSPYGDGIGQSGAVFYNSAWSLVRYTIDRYAASDAAFFRTLMNSTTSGTTNLAATAGVSMDQLIGGWGLALYADDYPGLASPSADIQFPTWNLRSIYGGLNASPTWQPRFPRVYPVQPTALAFGPFAARVTGMRGGAHAYFELSGSALPVQLLSVRGANGAPTTANLRIAIARLQ